MRIIRIDSGFDLKKLDVINRELLTSNKQVTFDLSDMEFCSAPGAMNLILVLAYSAKKGNENILIPPRSMKVQSFLNFVGFDTFAQNYVNLTKRFFSSIDDEKKISNQNILRIIHLFPPANDEDFDQWAGQIINNKIVRKFTFLLDGRYQSLITIFSELSRNIFEHSESYGYLAAQVIENSFIVSIGDLGIGIYKSLTPYYRKYGVEEYGPLWNELKAIDISFGQYVSRKNTDHEIIGGIGLNQILTLIIKHNGRLTVRSGHSKIQTDFSKSTRAVKDTSKLPYFPGTQFELIIPI
jgi:hypothetical protein